MKRMKKRPMRKDRVYCRLAGGDNIIVCRVDHRTHKLTKWKECKYIVLDPDPLYIPMYDLLPESN